VWLNKSAFVGAARFGGDFGSALRLSFNAPHQRVKLAGFYGFNESACVSDTTTNNHQIQVIETLKN
jgi:hypothetical protein